MSDPGFWNNPLWQRFPITPLTLAQAVAVLVLAWGSSRLLQRALERKTGGFGLHSGVRYSVSRLMHYTLMGVGMLMALRLLGVGIASIAVVVGALGIGIGFGLQTLVANFVSGVVLLLERPIRVGDRISLGHQDTDDATRGVNGYVTAIRLRATTVVTPDNISLIVPNSELVTRTVVNWSHTEPRIRVRLALPAAYDSDIEEVRRLVAAVAAAHPEVLPFPAPEVRLAGFGESALEFQLLAWTADPRGRGRIESDLRVALVAAFRARNITIPFPRRDVRIVGNAPGSASA